MNPNTLKPAFKTTCIQGPPLCKDHLSWSCPNSACTINSDHLLLRPLFCCPEVVAIDRFHCTLSIHVQVVLTDDVDMVGQHCCSSRTATGVHGCCEAPLIPIRLVPARGIWYTTITSWAFQQYSKVAADTCTVEPPNADSLKYGRRVKPATFFRSRTLPVGITLPFTPELRTPR